MDPNGTPGFEQLGKCKECESYKEIEGSGYCRTYRVAVFPSGCCRDFKLSHNEDEDDSGVKWYRPSQINPLYSRHYNSIPLEED